MREAFLEDLAFELGSEGCSGRAATHIPREGVPGIGYCNEQRLDGTKTQSMILFG